MMNTWMMADVEKTEEEKGDNEQVGNEMTKVDQAKDTTAQDKQATAIAFVTQKEQPEIQPTNSSLSVSSSFDNQFLNLSFDTFLAIEASVQSNVINKVKNQLPKVVKDLVESRMESMVQNVLQKDPINLEQHQSQKDASEIHDAVPKTDSMATPIVFSKFAMNRLNLHKITKADLVGLVYKLLKGTCQSSIELEYNMEECYKALSDRLDWTNPEGDICPYDLSKPLPLKVT
ncbi:hypothetical protein Tco_0848983 [Tanacetum coccineum]